LDESFSVPSLACYSCTVTLITVTFLLATEEEESEEEDEVLPSPRRRGTRQALTSDGEFV
jgi:hypothetical protein